MKKISNYFTFSPNKTIKDTNQIATNYKYWRIRTFLALYIGYATFYITRKNLTPILHVFSENLGISLIDLGMISATFSITYGVGKLFSGILADKLNIRYFMSIGLLLSGIINLFYGFLTPLWALAFLWGINGLCQATGSPSVAKSLVYWFSPRERAKFWSLWASSKTAGLFAAGGLISLLLKYCEDWRAVFYVPGLVSIGIAIYLFWALRDTPVSVGLPPIEKFKNDIIPVLAKKKEKKHQWLVLKKYVFGNPCVWYLAFALSFVYFVRFSTLDWTTKFLYETRGIDKVSVAVLWNLMPLFGMPGGIVAGYLVSKFFKGRCVPVTIIYLGILALCIYGYVMFAGKDHLVLTCIFIAAIGFFVDGPQVLISGIMLSRMTAQESTGAAIGFCGFWSYILGTAVFANMGAVFLVEKFGWNYMYYTCIVSTIIAILLVAICAKKERAELAKK